MDSLERLDERRLPPREKWTNDLLPEPNDNLTEEEKKKLNKERVISDRDWEFVNKVWREFKLKTFGEFLNLYMDSDVCLLADVFERFRSDCLKSYGLDPVHFSTAPGLSWHACLKMTKVRLQVITDPDMNLFIDISLLGGVSYARNMYLKANHSGIKDYNPDILTTWLLLVDCNNQYGWAMSQYLPTHGFKWVEDLSMFTEDFIKNLKNEQDIGYIMEVDLFYPDNLHDAHDQYPLAPNKVNITEDMLSEHQKQLASKLCCKIGGEKLCLTLSDKKNYISHYRLIRQCLDLGMKLGKVHRVLQFNQSPWVKPYIERNTSLRQNANCKAEEDLPKLMNNSFFGKFLFCIL